MLVDSHCHLNLLDAEFNKETIKRYVKDAQQQGVWQMLCVSVSLERIPEVLWAAHTLEGVRASVGLHPCEANSEPYSCFDLLKRYACSANVIAIGETGLDYYHQEHLNKQRQKQRFVEQIQLSQELRKPLVIHTRNSSEDTLEVLKSEGIGGVSGVFHCFVESYEVAKKVLDLGFYISISGIVTFKNARDLQDVVRKLPQDRVLVETDSPYLAPVPYRGKPNRPAYVRHVAQTVAALWGKDYESVCQQTTENYKRLFYSDL